MKLTLIAQLTPKKARTFDSTEIVEKLTALLGEAKLQLTREILRAEGKLQEHVFNLIPVKGKPYRPTQMEQTMIDELERKLG